MPSVPPQILSFTFGDAPVNAGDMAAVQCMIVKGDAPTSLEWRFNGEIVEPGLGISISPTNPRISTLSIEAVNAEHRGAYSCLASNPVGQTNHTAVLNVNGKLFAEF